MPPRLTPAERRQAIAYRAMIRQARRRERATNPIKLEPPRGRQIDRSHKAAVARLFCIAAAIRFGIERYGVHVAHVRFSSAAFASVSGGILLAQRVLCTYNPSPQRKAVTAGEGGVERGFGKFFGKDDLNCRQNN